MSAQDVNEEALAALQRLADALSNLDDGGIDTANPIRLSHWRDLTDDVKAAYKMLDEGAELVRATSTKYTLVGKISMEDGKKLAPDLRRGCELVGTGAVLLHAPNSGCARSTRTHAKKSARAVVASTIHLINGFLDRTAFTENVGAQRTGAVWSICDAVAKVPRGNRSAMRRDLLTWAGECNDTMQEFAAIVKLGPVRGGAATDGAGPSWDDFCETETGTGDLYTHGEIGVVEACLALIKCSRGAIGACLKAAEAAGDEVARYNDSKENDGSEIDERKTAVLRWIQELHDSARTLGDGVTDLGCLLYPPLELLGRRSISDASGDKIKSELAIQLERQRDAVLAVTVAILDASPNGKEIIPIPEEVIEISSKLVTACGKRFNEAKAAMKAIA